MNALIRVVKGGEKLRVSGDREPVVDPVRRLGNVDHSTPIVVIMNDDGVAVLSVKYAAGRPNNFCRPLRVKTPRNRRRRVYSEPVFERNLLAGRRNARVCVCARICGTKDVLIRGPSRGKLSERKK